MCYMFGQVRPGVYANEWKSPLKTESKYPRHKPSTLSRMLFNVCISYADTEFYYGIRSLAHFCSFPSAWKFMLIIRAVNPIMPH